MDPSQVEYMHKVKKILIVGAGLSGLYLAYLLHKKNIPFTILEASQRVGGRIQTIKGQVDTPLELGATWFANTHEHIVRLIDELGLKKYPQFTDGISFFEPDGVEMTQKFHIPKSDSPSFKIAGGTETLIQKLYEKLNPEDFYLQSKVESIIISQDDIILKTNNNLNISGSEVVLCMPPQLIASQISFEPNLPEQLNNLLPNVQTWMSGSIKFVLEYDHPFWKEKKYSGIIYSQNGMVLEMYDHTNYEQNKFGFTGFLHPSYGAHAKDKRKTLLINYLSRVFGNEAAHPLFYEDKIWTGPYILGENKIIFNPHQNNGHALLQNTYLNGKLFFCGTETSPIYPGYMEGALQAVHSVFSRLISE